MDFFGWRWKLTPPEEVSVCGYDDDDDDDDAMKNYGPEKVDLECEHMLLFAVACCSSVEKEGRAEWKRKLVIVP